MLEAEVKFPADLTGAADRLEDLGADPGAERRQRDVYFAAPHRDFAATDEALRVRTVDGDAVTTYKGAPRGEATKTREELEVGVGEAATMTAIYEALGFDRVATVEKHRRTYAIEDVTVCLDEVDGVGDYVELEAVGDGDAGADEAGLREQLESAAAMLDLDWEDGVTTSYLEMVLADR